MEQSHTVASVVEHASTTAPVLHNERPTPTLHTLVESFRAAEALENPDVTLPLRSLRMSENGTVAVPDLGTFAFTDWSRAQCASRLGIRFDRWFENAARVERAAEMNRRFSRASGDVRLRTSRDVPADSAARGTLRAFVSPTYAAIPDSLVAELLADALAGRGSDLGVQRADVTDRSTTYVVRVAEAPVVHARRVGDTWGTIVVRNSGVGFASLFVGVHLVRLVCLNGMIAPVGDPVLVKRRHLAVDVDTLRERLAGKVQRLPEVLEAAFATLAHSRDRRVAAIETALAGVLEEAALPRRLLPALVEAYGEEPAPTMFGVAQAVTRAAQRLTPEQRFELETAAGRYLASA